MSKALICISSRFPTKRYTQDGGEEDPFAGMKEDDDVLEENETVFPNRI